MKVIDKTLIRDKLLRRNSRALSKTFMNSLILPPTRVVSPNSSTYECLFVLTTSHFVCSPTRPRNRKMSCMGPLYGSLNAPVNLFNSNECSCHIFPICTSRFLRYECTNTHMYRWGCNFRNLTFLLGTHVGDDDALAARRIFE